MKFTSTCAIVEKRVTNCGKEEPKSRSRKVRGHSPELTPAQAPQALQGQGEQAQAGEVNPAAEVTLSENPIAYGSIKIRAESVEFAEFSSAYLFPGVNISPHLKTIDTIVVCDLSAHKNS